jgi:hypothetical protein
MSIMELTAIVMGGHQDVAPPCHEGSDS